MCQEDLKGSGEDLKGITDVRLHSPLGLLSTSNHDAFSPISKDAAAISSSNTYNMDRMMTPMQRRKILINANETNASTRKDSRIS